jgi:hypothetical protein
MKYVQRTASGATCKGHGTAIKNFRAAWNGFLGNGLGTTIKYLRQRTAKYLRGAAGVGLGTTNKYPRCTTR